MMTAQAEEVEDPKTAMRRRAEQRRAQQAQSQASPEVQTKSVVAEIKPQPAERPVAQPVGRQILYFDLETVPDFSRQDRYELDPLPEIVQAKPETPADQCPKVTDAVAMTVPNLERELEKLSPDEAWLAQLEKAEQEGKKREGILKAIQACRAAKRIGETSAAARTAAEEARIKKMSVTPEMCRIAALGYALGDGEPVSMVVGLNDVTEEGILETFWGLLRSHSPLVGFNILGFDLPVIFVRSAILGVLPTKLIDMKAWGQDTIDLMQARFPKSGATRLKELARMYGFNIPAGDTDGGAVYQLMQTEPVKVAEYVKSDIVVTRQLHHFYRGFFCR